MNKTELEYCKHNKVVGVHPGDRETEIYLEFENGSQIHISAEVTHCDDGVLCMILLTKEEVESDKQKKARLN